MDVTGGAKDLPIKDDKERGYRMQNIIDYFKAVILSCFYIFYSQKWDRPLWLFV